MLIFPQLSSGSLVQYPMTKTIEHRTVLNEAADGSAVRYCDAEAARTSWILRYTGLTDAERSGLENLFAAAEGRLRPFVFVDPVANLLRWSGDLSQPVWSRDPLLQASGTRPVRLTNASQTTQAVRQQVEAPPGWHYCFSALLRSKTVEKVVLRISCATGAVDVEETTGPDWQRGVCTAPIGGDGKDLTVELRLQAGAKVDVAELQLDAQPMPSAYKPSGSVGGVHEMTRFDQDEIVFTTEGKDDNSTTLRVVSLGGGSK